MEGSSVNASPEKPLKKFDDLAAEHRDLMLKVVRGCLEKLQEAGLLDKKTGGSIEQQEAALIRLIDEGLVKPQLLQCGDGVFQARFTVWNGYKYVPLGKFSEEEQ
jgi:hypothetical protein